MEASILLTTKQILGLPSDEEGFDQEILTLIRSAFATLDQLGVPIVDVTDDSAEWADIDAPDAVIDMVRSYVPLRAQLGWDPPTLSFLLDMKKEQLSEFEWRIRLAMEAVA